MSKDLIDVTQDVIPPEENERLKRNVLFYPIAKSFFDSFPQYSDIMRTYEASIESIADIVGTDSIINETIRMGDKTSAKFKCWIDNVRIYSPDSLEAAQFSNIGYVPTPNIALAQKSLYACLVMGDVNYSYSIINDIDSANYAETIISRALDKNTKPITHTFKIPNGYIVNVPIPIGCKWCSLRHYDPLTLIRSGEELGAMYGYFVVDGFYRHILPNYTKPFNKPITYLNTHKEDNQISRTDVLYSKGFDYESSYYMIGALVVPASQHTGRGGATISPPDYGFALMFDHPAMNKGEKSVAKTMEVDNSTAASQVLNSNKINKHALINFVPIKFLFCAFGCLTDEDMIKFICPQLDDFGLINSISYACLQGFKHREAVQAAGIKLKVDPNYIFYEEPMTELTAKYIIANIILNDTAKQQLLDRAGKNESDFKWFMAETVSHIFDERFMPGIGSEELGSKVDRNTAVCVELGIIIRKMYMVGYGLEEAQTKPMLTNRRVRTGQQMAREYKAFHNARNADVIEQVRKVFETNKDPAQINQVLDSRMKECAKNMGLLQTSSLINTFKSDPKKASKLRTDLIVLKNQIFVWNHLRELVITDSTDKNGSGVKWEHRDVHQSELYFICPTQTPEGAGQTGRYKTPTLFSYVTTTSKGKHIIELVQSNPAFIPSMRNVKHPEELFIIRMNGYIIGYVPQYEPVEKLYAELMHARQTGEIEVDASIVLNQRYGDLNIWTDAGRIVGPFVVVKNAFNLEIDKKDVKEGEDIRLSGKVTPKPEFIKFLQSDSPNMYQDAIKAGYVEILDPDMAINNAVIAGSLKDFYEKPHIFTHVAFPNHIHGIIAGVVPAVNLNAGVRTSYLTNHVKQAIGPTTRYPQLKYINEENVLICPQAPLVRTCVYNFLRLPETPYGNNVIVCFLQFKYNQEDAIILNRASVESGLLKIDALVTKTHRIESNSEEFKVPPSGTVLNGNIDSYAKIDITTALPAKLGDTFYEHDVLIAKINKTAKGVSDTSILNNQPDGKYPVSANPRPLRFVCKNKIHANSTKIKMAMFGQYRVPIVGDKFNSEHAQKGTVGCVMDPELLPYSTTGIRPDVIFNPPSIFKRKTFGHVYLPTVAKIAALLGCPIDCTPYSTVRSDTEICELYHRLGLDDAGFETMYDGRTGRAYKSKVFFANHYWERQSHLVENKSNIRNRGPRDPVTGQPTKGRKRGGGQNMDRMGFDANVASGICELIRDSRLNQCSKIKIGICNRCHCTMGYFDAPTKRWVCPRCGPHPEITIREVPTASTLLLHIFNGLHIAVDYFDHIDNTQTL